MAITVEGTESMLKGAIAETMVQQMFQVSEVPIARLGHEYKMLDFVKGNGSQSLAYNDVRQRLSLAPDFVIRNKNNELELIEVKYCQQGRFHPNEAKDLPLLNDLWSPTIVLVSYNLTFDIPHFLVVPPPFRLSGDCNPIEAYPILQEKRWGISEEAVNKCVSLISIFEYFMPLEQRQKNKRRT